MRYLVEVEPTFQPLHDVRGAYCPPAFPLALCASSRKAYRIADGFNLHADGCRAVVKQVNTPRRSWAQH